MLATLGSLLNGVVDNATSWIQLTLGGDSVTAVFGFLRAFYTYLPDVLQTLFVTAFGGMVFLAVLRGIGR